MTAKRPAWLAAKIPFTRPAAPAMPPVRRPFSTPKPSMPLDLEAARPTARIFLFTGSNTPYESHE